MLLLFSISTPAIFHLYWSNVLNLLLELVGLAPCKLQIANPMLPNLILPTENFPTPFHFFKDSGQIFNTVSNTSHVQFLPLADLPGRLSCTPPSPPGSSLFSRFFQGVMVFPYCFAAMNHLPPQLWRICQISVRSPRPQGSICIFFFFLAFIICNAYLVYSPLPH